MHIVLLAWLYLVGMMAITASSVLGGLLLFVSAGMLPVLALAWSRGRRRRARDDAGRAGSAFEPDVHHRDDADA